MRESLYLALHAMALTKADSFEVGSLLWFLNEERFVFWMQWSRNLISYQNDFKLRSFLLIGSICLKTFFVIAIAETSCLVKNRCAVPPSSTEIPEFLRPIAIFN